MSDFFIAVDLGGTNLRIAAVNEQGKLMEKISLSAKVARDPRSVIADMCGAITRLQEKYRGTSSLHGIGVGMPGVYDQRTGRIHEAPNLPGWDKYPVKAEIETQLGTQVTLENDGNVAALGEKWLGAARGLEDMAILTLGTGVGGGLVFGGRIWRGVWGAAGELGHIPVEPEGVPCGCGNRGCLEQYASASAVVRMAREAIAAGRAPELARVGASDAEFGAKAVYELAMQGNPEAGEIFQTVGRALGIALGMFVNILNLPMYVVGGGLAGAWDAFAPTMFKELRYRALAFAAVAQPEEEAGAIGRGQTVVTRAQLGSDAGLYGAAYLAMMTRAG
jgi:glucokinase